MAKRPKLPRLDHVKYVTSKGHTYAYFNTGKVNEKGNAIYSRLPHPSEVGFFDKYAAAKAVRTKSMAVEYLVRDLVADYEIAMEKRTDLKEGSKALYRMTNKRVIELVGTYPVNKLEVSDVQYALDHKMPGNGARNIFLSVVRNLYSWGRLNKKTTQDPTRDLKPVKSGEHEPWPEQILRAGLKAKDGRTRLAINLLFYTGQRIGDVIKMRWTDIIDGEIHVIQEKTDKEVTPPIHRDLAKELAKLARVGDTILCNEKGKPFTTQTIRADLKAFSLSMGKECVPHGLRKNAVITLLEAGCTIAEVSSITGQTFQIVEKYAHRVNRRRLGKTAIGKMENKE